MEIFLEPSTYAALATLIVLEVVLGIDNLVFIAILADKLPPQQRNRARVIGLSLALLMRILLLTVMSHLIHLTNPLFHIGETSFSARDLIMFVGGLFLIYKATIELHERLDTGEQQFASTKTHVRFWTVVAQIIILDAVFSLDAVITAVGMVEHLLIMIVAVSIAILLMLLAAKPLTDFVSGRPTVVVLCLGFLLLIGLSLIAEGFNFHIPKGYLYAAIGFSILIESFNQVSNYNKRKSERKKPLRIRTAQAVFRLLGEEGLVYATPDSTITDEPPAPSPSGIVNSEEVNIVSRVLTLSDRTVRSVMTHRSDVAYLELNDTIEEQKEFLLEESYNLVPVCRGGLDNVIGVGYSSTFLSDILHEGAVQTEHLQEPLIIPETMRVINALKVLRTAMPHFLLVADEYGTIEGIVTAIDIFEALAGDMTEEGEPPTIQNINESTWLLAGSVDVHLLEHFLNIDDVASESHDYTSLAGFMLVQLDRLPELGDSFEFNGYAFTVEEMDERRISLVKIEKL